MSILKLSKKSPSTGMVRWRPRLPRLRSGERPGRPLAATGVAATLVGGAAAAIVLGGVAVTGVGVLAISALAIGGYWLRARRKGLWLHVLVDSDDLIVSLALPLPLKLIRWGLEVSPVSDDAVNMVRMFIEDPEVLETLHKDAIEIAIDSGDDHIEVLIGPRRKYWRTFQFNPIRSFSQTKRLSQLEENSHV